MNEQLPFDDAYFDAVSCVASLEISANTPRLIQEFNRVLKAGGELVIVASNIAYITRRFRALLGKPPRVSGCSGFMDGGVLHYFTLTSLVSLIEQQGFFIIRKANSGKLWFLRKWWISLLSGSLVVKAVKSEAGNIHEK